MRLLLVSVAVVWLGSFAVAQASASHEPPPDLSFVPERAEFDLSRGHDIGNIVAAVRREYPGALVDARYVDHGAHSPVRVELLTKHGVRLAIVVEPRTGALLQIARGGVVYTRGLERCHTAMVFVPDFVASPRVPPQPAADRRFHVLVRNIAHQIPGEFLDARPLPEPRQAGAMRVRWLTPEGARLDLAVDAVSGRVLGRVDDDRHAWLYRGCEVHFAPVGAQATPAR